MGETPRQVPAEELQAERMRRGWTLAEMARRLGLTPRELKRIEEGKQNVSDALQVKLMEVEREPYKGAPPKHVGQMLRRERMRRNWSLGQMARDIGLHRTHVASIEKSRTPINLHGMRRLLELRQEEVHKVTAEDFKAERFRRGWTLEEMAKRLGTSDEALKSLEAGEGSVSDELQVKFHEVHRTPLQGRPRNELVTLLHNQRVLRGWTSVRMGQELGIQPSHVNRAERGELPLGLGATRKLLELQTEGAWLDPPQNVAEEFKAERLRRGWSVARMSIELGVGEEELERIEAGQAEVAEEVQAAFVQIRDRRLGEKPPSALAEALRAERMLRNWNMSQMAKELGIRYLSRYSQIESGVRPVPLNAMKRFLELQSQRAMSTPRGDDS